MIEPLPVLLLLSSFDFVWMDFRGLDSDKGEHLGI